MTKLGFEWDDTKSRDNARKHGVTFAEAQTVFFDENAVEFFDDEHSTHEDQFLLLGLSSKLRVLLVCHCLRESGSVIRIISARKATKNERGLYPKGEA
ncbi:MAG TPA: BrnT family toxin [Kiritimatiellia bacterium]|nr:BrnT family toxin [Kiritimatiellia bacterium]HMO97649.1 BrnT family toxin [Kiritimatiellia bacterium]HMP95510.1 BrnT family toxin [Kiritimatiellia bacterium]